MRRSSLLGWTLLSTLIALLILVVVRGDREAGMAVLWGEAAFSSDGSRLLARPDRLLQPGEHAGFAPNLHAVVSRSLDGTTVWDARLERHRRPPSAVISYSSISANPETLLTMSPAGEGESWYCMGLLDRSGILAAEQEDGRLVVHDPATGRPLGPPLPAPGNSFVTISPDGHLLATLDGWHVTVHDTRSGAVVFRTGHPRAAAVVQRRWQARPRFSEDGAALAVLYPKDFGQDLRQPVPDDGTPLAFLSRWRTDDWSPLPPAPDLPSAEADFALAGIDGPLAVFPRPLPVRSWNRARPFSGACLVRWPAGNPAAAESFVVRPSGGRNPFRTASFSTDGRRVAFADAGPPRWFGSMSVPDHPGEVLVVDAGSGKSLRRRWFDVELLALRWTGPSDLILAGQRGDQLLRWNVAFDEVHRVADAFPAVALGLLALWTAGFVLWQRRTPIDNGPSRWPATLLVLSAVWTSAAFWTVPMGLHRFPPLWPPSRDYLPPHWHAALLVATVPLVCGIVAVTWHERHDRTRWPLGLVLFVALGTQATYVAWQAGWRL